MQLPKILTFHECSDYFEEFYRINKELNPEVTFRFLAQEFNWPISYLSDVISSRKPFTVSRATTFIKYFGMDAISSERLIYLALKDSNTGEIKKYFTLKLEEDSSYIVNEESFGYIPNEDVEIKDEEKDFFVSSLSSDNELVGSAILKILVWSNGVILMKNISKLLYTFPELQNPSILKDQILKLEKNKIIKIIKLDMDSILEVEILEESIHFILSYKTVVQTAKFSDNMSRILRDPKVAGNFSYGFINLHKSKWKEAQVKMNTLRNWLLLLDKKSATENSCLEDFMLFQYDLNLGVLMDFRVTDIKNLEDWESR